MARQVTFPSASSASSAATVTDDATLVGRARQGDDGAFAALYRRHARYVAGVVHRSLGPDAESDDVMQEAFCDAARALRSLDEPSEFRAWIARIAVRRAHKRIGRKRRWSWLPLAVEELTLAAFDLATRQRVYELHEALRTLPPKLRDPWVFHVIEGETLPAVARRCDVSLATTKRRIAEACTRVGRHLHDA